MPLGIHWQKSRVVIATPLATPWIYWRTVAAILEMEKPRHSDLMVFQGALVDRARNCLVEKMLDHPIAPTHLFFLDADIVPAPDTLAKLLKVDRPIVSGVYRRRLPPYEPMAFVRKDVGARLASPLVPISLNGPRLRRVNYVGAGCLLIRREVLERIPPPWFTSEWEKGGHLSEDFSFCQKAGELGYEIWADTSVRPLHLEPVGIGTDPKGAVCFASLDSI